MTNGSGVVTVWKGQSQSLLKAFQPIAAYLAFAIIDSVDDNESKVVRKATEKLELGAVASLSANGSTDFISKLRWH